MKTWNEIHNAFDQAMAQFLDQIFNDYLRPIQSNGATWRFLPEETPQVMRVWFLHL